MVNNHPLDPAILRELLEYDPKTGRLSWKKRDKKWFPSGCRGAGHNASVWNARYAGCDALSCLNQDGYLHGNILGKTVRAHRAIWAMTHGEWPAGEVDHINGDPADNRQVNLRDVPHSHNVKNVRMRQDNTSGATGVYQRESGKWRAWINVDGKRISCGDHATFSRAVAARAEAKKVHGFTDRHGEAV